MGIHAAPSLISALSPAGTFLVLNAFSSDWKKRLKDSALDGTGIVDVLTFLIKLCVLLCLLTSFSLSTVIFYKDFILFIYFVQ